MSFNGFLDLSGTPSLIATNGNKLVLGTQGDQDIEFIRNGQTVFRVTNAGVVAQFDLPNNVWLQTRNAANTADLNLLRANTSNDTELNVAQTDGSIRFTINGILGAAVQQTSGANVNVFRVHSPDTTRIISIGSTNGGILYCGTETNHSLRLMTNNITRLILANDGTSLLSQTGANFAIGTADFNNLQFRTNNTTRFEIAGDGSSVTIYPVGGGCSFGTAPTGVLKLKTQNLNRWQITTGGSLIQDVDGGNFVLSKANTAIILPVATGISAAGTNSATATALSMVINNVTTVASGTGVRLWAAGVGATIVVRNSGANPLLVYPNTGGTINGGAVDAGVTVAVGTSVSFYVIADNTWVT
jgi:hypothetical protein